MPNSEIDQYLTAAEMVPYAAPLAKVVQVVMQLYDFGTTNQTDQAIALLQDEVKRISAELVDINNRLDELNRAVAQDENLRRIGKLIEHGLEFSALASRLKTEPATAAEIAFEAGQRADVCLTDSDLWLWTDTVMEPGPDGQGKPHANAEADFKSFPALPVYALGLAVYLQAVQMETGGNRQLVLSRHGQRLRRHITNVSVRRDWVDGRQAPQTLPEQIRSRITCEPRAQTTCAENGHCRFTIVCNDAIARKHTVVGEVTVDMPAGENVLCTADPSLGVAEEQQAEAQDNGILVLAALEMMLRQLEVSGSLGDQYMGQFGGWSRAQQQFAIRAHLAVGEGVLGGFPTFRETTQGLDVYGGTVFLSPNAGERRDVKLADLGGLSLTPLSDSKFGEWMRAANTYASANGFIGGFPTGFFGDLGQGPECPLILIRRDAAEWREVYLDELGNPPVRAWCAARS